MTGIFGHKNLCDKFSKYFKFYFDLSAARDRRVHRNPNGELKILWKAIYFSFVNLPMKMSTHEDDDQDQDQEINVDSDSRLSCGSNSDVDMDGDGSCYDSETALGWVDFLLCSHCDSERQRSTRTQIDFFISELAFTSETGYWQCIRTQCEWLTESSSQREPDSKNANLLRAFELKKRIFRCNYSRRNWSPSESMRLHKMSASADRIP